MPQDSDISFGQVALGMGLLSKQDLSSCMEDLRGASAKSDLVSLIREKGLLNESDIARVLGRMSARPMVCPKCASRYVVGKTAAEGKKVLCRRCKTALVPGDAQPPRASDPFVGKEIAQCRIDRKIGEGGMGAIYHGMHVALGRQVAIKILPMRAHKRKEHIERFIKEARAAARLDHPNVVSVYDVGRMAEPVMGEDFYYIVMQYVDGESLHQRIDREGRLDPHEATRIMRDAAEGLAAAHGKGVVHRDVKPGNIMLGKDGSVKVTDFGLAKSQADTASLTITGQLLGTPGYMSPEQARGEKVDRRSDIYSLGVSYYHCLCGVLPYVGTSLDVIRRHADEAPVPHARDLDPTIPESISVVLSRMLGKNAEQRYQSATDLKVDLNQLLLGKRPYFFMGSEAGPQQLISGMSSAGKSGTHVYSSVAAGGAARETAGSGVVALILLLLAVLAAGEGFLIYREFRRSTDPVGAEADARVRADLERLLAQIRTLDASASQGTRENVSPIAETLDSLRRIDDFIKRFDSPTWQAKIEEARKSLDHLVTAKIELLDQDAQVLVQALRFDEAARMYQQAMSLGQQGVSELAAARLDEIARKKEALVAEMSQRVQQIEQLAGSGRLFAARRSLLDLERAYPTEARALLAGPVGDALARLSTDLRTGISLIRVAPGGGGDVQTLTEALTLAARESDPITIEIPEPLSLVETFKGVSWEKLRDVPVTVLGSGLERPTILLARTQSPNGEKNGDEPAQVQMLLEGKWTFRNIIFQGPEVWPDLPGDAAIATGPHGAVVEFENCDFHHFDVACEAVAVARPGVSSSLRLFNCVFRDNRIAVRLTSAGQDSPAEHGLTVSQCVFYGAGAGSAFYHRVRGDSPALWKVGVRNTILARIGTVFVSDFAGPFTRDPEWGVQLDFDYNAYHEVAGYYLPLGDVRPRKRDIPITDHKRWRLLMRMDSNSVTGKDPLFESPADNDFRLRRRSSLRRRGEDNAPMGLLFRDEEAPDTDDASTEER